MNHPNDQWENVSSPEEVAPEVEEDIEEEDETAKKVKKLKRKLDDLALAMLIIGFIGIISIICGIFVGRASDPKDYYGTYYGVVDYTYMTYHIEEEGAFAVYNNGTDMDTETIEFVKMEFCSADKAQQKFSNPEYSGYNALLLYTDSSGSYAHVLWITDDAPYQFVLNANGAVLTTEEYDFKADMEDPEDYYKNYYYDSDNYIVFLEDGTAMFCLNGRTTEYHFAFVNSEWCMRWMNFDAENALLVYSPGNTNEIHTFIYKNSQKLNYGGYEFRAYD